jgi:hypothetical protein
MRGRICESGPDSARLPEREVKAGVVYSAMEFCEERDSPSKGGLALVPSRLCFAGPKDYRDGQQAQICPDGNSIGSTMDQRCNADGPCTVQARCTLGKIKICAFA